MKLLLNILLMVIVCSQCGAHSFQLENLNFLEKLDVWAAVQEYCNGRSLRNFCSDAHLQMVYEIVRKKKSEMENQRKLKKMKNEIVKDLIRIITEMP